MKTTHIWLTVLTIALVLNAVTMRNTADGDECTAGIRKEHLNQTDGAFVDGTTIEIGTNGLQIKDGAIPTFTPETYTGGESVTFPNGLIMKMGVESVAAYTTDDVTYGTAFPNAVVSMSVSYDASVGTTWIEEITIRTKSGYETSIAQIANLTGETKSIYWQTWGY